MRETMLPLFPLQLVLLPGESLPLHIFEDRYKEMLGEVIATKGHFGVLLAGEKGISSVGCTATVEKVIQLYADGRLDIHCVGRRRFELISLDQERAFLRGEVEFIDDDSAADAHESVRLAALESLKLLQKAIGDTSEIADSADIPLSFQIAQRIENLELRQSLLAMRSEAERLALLARYMPGYTLQLNGANRLRKLASQNGHGRSYGGDFDAT
jgi:Lon protease-like protein